MDINTTDFFKLINHKAMEFFNNKTEQSAMEMAIEIMQTEGFPMHCPQHHSLVPAVLLTEAAIKEDMSEDDYKMKLEKAVSRGKTIPGAVCGEFGACGAGIGPGIFASLWLNTTPKDKENLGVVGTFTANALSDIAKYQGPRCCKRVTFLGIKNGVQDAKSIGLQLKDTPVVCSFFKGNPECIGVKCQFFPKK